MLKSTENRYGHVEVGANVRIPIDAVDRGKTDPRNVLGVVMENNGGYYKIGTQHGFFFSKINLNKNEKYKGVLSHKLVRTAFATTGANHISLEDVPLTSTAISLRAASKASSQHGGQGFKHCNCQSGCANRCGCRRDGKLCNSKCHGSLSCKNK